MANTGAMRELQAIRQELDLVSGDLSSPSANRLKGRALELSALVGRLASRNGAIVPVELASDVLIAATGAANVLRIDLSKADLAAVGTDDPFASLAEAVGRLADAGERIDHLEEFVAQAREAILDLVRWSVAVGRGAGVAITSHAAETMKARTDGAPCP